MPSYLLETYAPVSQAEEVEAAVARLANGRETVRHLRATFVPEDDVCFFLLEGPSAEAAHQVAARSAVVARVTEATRSRGGAGTAPDEKTRVDMNEGRWEASSGSPAAWPREEPLRSTEDER